MEQFLKILILNVFFEIVKESMDKLNKFYFNL